MEKNILAAGIYRNYAPHHNAVKHQGQKFDKLSKGKYHSPRNQQIVNVTRFF